VKRSVIAFVSLLALAGLAQAAAPAGPTKIGVVNITRLMQDSPHARAAQATLQTEFGSEEREIQTLTQSIQTRQEKLIKDQATMSQQQRDAAERDLRDSAIDLQAKQDKVQDKFTARRNEEMNKLQRAVLEEVQKYAQTNGFDLVLADGVLYAGAALDITAPVLQALQARGPAVAPAAAPAPARPATP
jgi:outer membrane protein